MTGRKSKKIRLCIYGALAVLLILIAVFSDRLCPYNPYEQNLAIAYNPPSLEHIMGTDAYGRDMFSRIISGARVSIISTLVLVVIISVVGTLAGTICGYFGGLFDTVVMRISDVFLAFPGLVFALAIAAILGGGVSNAVIALAFVSWPKYSRLARGRALAVKEMTYVKAAKLSGDTPLQVIVRHILPNTIGTMLVTAMLDIGTMMMELAGLSFLGLGAKPPIAEWGSMMSSGRSMLQTYPWVVLSPGLAIFISVAVFNLLGDTLRDYLDPKQN
ncbi:MAG: ABC transporter permease [Lachnospiraceae bacterium]|nr:ABC transporter permease [Lachnospiraceae bacterium]